MDNSSKEAGKKINIDSDDPFCQIFLKEDETDLP